MHQRLISQTARESSLRRKPESRGAAKMDSGLQAGMTELNVFYLSWFQLD